MAHVPQMPQLPGYHAEKKRPWWASAMVGGIGLGLTLAAVLGLFGRGAEGAPHPTTATSTMAPPGSLSLDERLNRIETALGTMKEEVAELRAHLPKK